MGRVGAAEQNIRLDTDGTQLLDGVLGGLGLHFARRTDERNQRQVQEQATALVFRAHLANGFQKRQRLDIAHRAADLDQRHLGIVGAGLDAALDLVGDVRNDLHGAAEVLASTLLADHVLVDPAGRVVIGSRRPDSDKTLVVAQIQVRFRAILGDEHLAVLEGTHGARIHVDIGIQLDQRHPKAAGLKNAGKRGRGDALAQRGHNTACNEDISGHKNVLIDALEVEPERHSGRGSKLTEWSGVHNLKDPNHRSRQCGTKPSPRAWNPSQMHTPGIAANRPST